jgi:hypothetical protein
LNRRVFISTRGLAPHNKIERSEIVMSLSDLVYSERIKLRKELQCKLDDTYDLEKIRKLKLQLIELDIIDLQMEIRTREDDLHIKRTHLTKLEKAKINLGVSR